jgi:hypothetical protein
MPVGSAAICKAFMNVHTMHAVALLGTCNATYILNICVCRDPNLQLTCNPYPPDTEEDEDAQRRTWPGGVHGCRRVPRRDCQSVHISIKRTTEGKEPTTSKQSHGRMETVKDGREGKPSEKEASKEGKKSK